MGSNQGNEARGTASMVEETPEEKITRLESRVQLLEAELTGVQAMRTQLSDQFQQETRRSGGLSVALTHLKGNPWTGNRLAGRIQAVIDYPINGDPEAFDRLVERVGL